MRYIVCDHCGRTLQPKDTPYTLTISRPGNYLPVSQDLCEICAVTAGYKVGS